MDIPPIRFTSASGHHPSFVLQATAFGDFVDPRSGYIVGDPSASMALSSQSRV
jgi:hypothetical protein